MQPLWVSFFSADFAGNQLPPPVVSEMRAVAVRYITCGGTQSDAESVSSGTGAVRTRATNRRVKGRFGRAHEEAIFTPVDREGFVWRKPHNAFGTPRRVGLNGSAYFGRPAEVVNSPWCYGRFDCERGDLNPHGIAPTGS